MKATVHDPYFGAEQPGPESAYHASLTAEPGRTTELRNIARWARAHGNDALAQEADGYLSQQP